MKKELQRLIKPELYDLLVTFRGTADEYADFVNELQDREGVANIKAKLHMKTTMQSEGNNWLKKLFLKDKRV